MQISGSDGTYVPILHDVILWGNSAPEDAEIHVNLAGVQIYDSIVQGGCPSRPGVLCTRVLTGDPRLGTLADNGGFTPTMRPETGSVAIDSGTCVGPSFDQRAAPRPQGIACDIGAVEFVDPIFAGGFDPAMP